jgi:hypothetical protein
VNSQTKRLRSASPTQVTEFLNCARSWYNNYVLGIGPEFPPEYKARGIALHLAIETYLKTGEVLIDVEVKEMPGKKWETMQFVQAAIPHLPKPINDPYWDPWRAKGDGGLMLEQSGECGTYDDPDGKAPLFRQFIDLVEAYPDRAIIQDHKSLSDARYAKTPDELAHNTQLMANAHWLLLVSDYKEVTVQHMYLLTKGKRPKCWIVSVTVSREHVETEWQKTLAVIRQMSAWVELGPQTAEPLPPNTDFCDMYRGCPHKFLCFGAGASSGLLLQINRTMSKGESMSLIEQMKARASAAVAPTSSSVQGTSTPLAASPAPSGVLGKLLAGKVSAPNGLLTVSPSVPTAEVPAVGTVVVVAPAPVVPTTVGELPGYDANGIVPPDAPIPTSTPEEVAEASGETISSHGQDRAEASGEITTEAPAEGTKRKRRTKAEMEAARAEEATKTQIEAVNQENAAMVALMGMPKYTESPAAVTALPSGTGPVLGFVGATQGTFLGPNANTNLPLDQAPAKIEEVKFAVPPDAEGPQPNPAAEEFAKLQRMLLTPDPAFACPVQAIFIDCLPSKGWPGEAPVDLGTIMHSFNGLAAASAQVTDYRMIPYSSNGYLATAIKATMGSLPATLFVDSRLPGAAVFLEVVLPYARLVVRGVR